MKGQLLYNVNGDLTFHSLPKDFAGPYRIPDGIKVIADQAFQYCQFLTSIEIPDSVTNIGDYAFCGCSGLISINIPSRVTSIGDSTFKRCESLTSIDIPNGVTSIGKSAFHGCLQLNSITITARIQFIEGDAFADTPFTKHEKEQIFSYIHMTGEKDEKLNVKHPISSNLIGTSIITDSPPDLPYDNMVDLFDYDKSKEESSCLIRSGIKKIKPYAFGGCNKLIAIECEFPSSIKCIGNNAFRNCCNLLSFEIPSSVETIENNAFLDCRGLESIDIPNSVQYIGDYAFRNCVKLKTIDIPSNVKQIGKSAFDGCCNLKSISILGNTSIKWTQFKGCSALQKVKLNSFDYVIDNGLIYNAGRTEVFEFIPNLCWISKIVIDSTVTIIHRGAFSMLQSVQSIELPKSLKLIEGGAFDLESSAVNIIINTNDANQINVYYDSDRGWSSFLNITKRCSLTVPVGSVYDYRHHPVWGKFPKITTAEIDWGDEESEQ